MSNTTPTRPWYPVTHEDAVAANAALQAIAAAIDAGKSGTIYAFHVDDTESEPADKVTYLKDAVGMIPAKMNFTAPSFSWGSWGDAFFIPRPCMLKYDGTVDYYLDPNDYSKKADGTASDVANTSYGGNAMMEWGRDGKKIWSKRVPDPDGNGYTVYIADRQADADYTAWPFVNSNGDLVAHFYTPCYFGTIVNNGTADVLRSISGTSGSARCKSKTATVEREMAKRNNPSGSDIWDTEVFCDIELINHLLVLIAKTTDLQEAFGEGLHTSGSDAINNGFTNGQHDDKGLFWGTNDGTASSSTYGNAVKVFGMENWWGYMWRRYQGHVLIDGVQKYKLTKTTKDGSTATDYVVSDTASDYSGYIDSGVTLGSYSGVTINKMRAFREIILPSLATGTAEKDYASGMWTNTSGARFAVRGGSSGNAASAGAFALILNYAASGSHWGRGASPSCKPLS